MKPTRVTKVFIVVREGPAGPRYAPNKFQQRSKKFFSEREALERLRVLKETGREASIYVAEVSEWTPYSV